MIITLKYLLHVRNILIPQLAFKMGTLLSIDDCKLEKFTCLIQDQAINVWSNRDTMWDGIA